jgi:hypothetical protein
VPGRGLRWIFAKIHTFAISASFWTWAEENVHVFDAHWTRQSTPSARTRALHAAPSHTRVPCPCSRLFKLAKASAVCPRALLTSLEHEIAGVCPAHGVPAVARAPATVDRLAEPFLAPSHPRERLYAPWWSSQSEESSSASPETLDQGHGTSPDRRRT